jgi:hypothetical protein
MKPTAIQQLHEQREQILQQLHQLQQIRRGSVSQQYVEATRTDGTQVKRGPYFIYTFKDHQKTVSRYLRQPSEVQMYRQQIEAFRQFQALTKQLLLLGEQLSDAALQQPDALKKTSNSRSSNKLK